jgi:superfamily II DNA/RNA helicase
MNQIPTVRRNKPSIVVGTPGRIAELIVGREGEKVGKLKLSNCLSIPSKVS